MKLTEVKISYKPSKSMGKKLKITRSGQAYLEFEKIWSKNRGYKEEAYILLLNRANKVIGWHHLGTGGTTGVIMDTKIIAQLALITNSHGIILAHNHPSGEKKPSHNDISITMNLRKVLKLLGIDLLDHLIITPQHYLSMVDKNYI